ncbi:peptidase C15, pyroglutamyl peptidase I-like protein [Paraphaeosphaeria sporulosa]|uniref:Peptidase C15, pyroglutamyl peptidase I-like protein n=1 Tax=Paraphaeosphaeria sporulosa TaxID=1460663 RepID=A0A177C3I8_9PLEO|nr:peptidase C15, pyroglutamyl peptidase I-like protein [Paraphaeosphaeria sporulosa]OAG02304.1 peptidase C15, pyroglutamyl peptidase I-like protein [Paraphaeosphaeria sporulosa]
MAPLASTLTRVLITGFGPFGTTINNPSWGIASRLPTTLPNNISLLVHPSAVPVAYHPVIDLVPDLIADLQPDISLHIGLAEGRTYFAVEQTSRKNVYGNSRDVEGQPWTNAEGEEYWAGEEERLSTALDLRSVVEEWQGRTEGIVWPQDSSKASILNIDDDGDVRWSDNVGTYLCAFIYYASMVEMSRETVGGRRDTAFMHVPMLRSEAELQMGVNITVELVQSLVDTWRAQRAAESD